MNGVHDMGGMDGLGVVDSRDPGPFPKAWEARVFALTLAAGSLGRWTLDESRFRREAQPGERYLSMSYYERWFEALTDLLVVHGVISEVELARGRAEGPSPPLAVTPEQMAAVLSRGGPSQRLVSAPPRFSVGDRVRAANFHPHGHTRLPRYARGHVGMVVRRHGAHVFPDCNAHGEGEQPTALYQIAFEAHTLWGARAQSPGLVHLDLWEPYLEPA